MPFVTLGRAGNRLSQFLAASDGGAAYTRGARFILCGAFVNELTVWESDAYVVDSYESAGRRADDVAGALGQFVQSAVSGGNEVVLGTAVAVPYYEADEFRLASFAKYNQRLRELAAQHRSTGLVRLADADAKLSAQQKNSLFSPDHVHFSASGDIAYAQLLAECTRGTVQRGAADIGQLGGQAGHDGRLDNNDFIVFINAFFARDPAADQGTPGGLAGHDGAFDNNDFIAFISAFFAG